MKCSTNKNYDGEDIDNTNKGFANEAEKKLKYKT